MNGCRYGEFFVARDRAQSRIVGALRLIWSDPVVWPDSNEPAGNVHGLVIDREFSGTSLGERLLVWPIDGPRRRTRSTGGSIVSKRTCGCAATTETRVSPR